MILYSQICAIISKHSGFYDISVTWKIHLMPISLHSSYPELGSTNLPSVSVDLSILAMSFSLV